MIGVDSLTTVVLDWNLPAYTVRCVDSLVADGIDPGRVVVVLNGPTDENWMTVKDRLASCILVRIEHNIGFARANNIGARVLAGDAYLLCNNDAFVHADGSVHALLAALDRPGVGIAVPRLLNEDGSHQPSVVPFTTPTAAAVRASGLSRLVPNRWQPRLSTHWDHAESREIEAAVGAVVMVGARAWDRVGGLHETAFMYAEDLDLCWRAHHEGFATWFTAEAEFIHIGGASSDRRWTDRQRAEQIARSESAMIQSHLSPGGAALTLGFMKAGLVARVVCFSLLGRTEAAESCRGSLEGLGESRRGDAPEPERDSDFEVLYPRV